MICEVHGHVDHESLCQSCIDSLLIGYDVNRIEAIELYGHGLHEIGMAITAWAVARMIYLNTVHSVYSNFDLMMNDLDYPWDI